METDQTAPADTVATELSAIFGAPNPTRAGRPAATAIARAAPGPRLTAAGGLAALALAGTVGVALGWLQARQTGEPEPSVTRMAAAPVAPPTFIPVAPAPVAPVVAPPARVAAAEPLRIPPRSPTAARAPRRGAPAVAGMARCARLAPGERRWCAHRVVMAEDRSLRSAYSRAVRAGVPRAVLADYSRRWARLRHDADDNPGRVAGGYAAMTQELTRRAQSGHHRR